jgi:hypothetical protein
VSAGAGLGWALGGPGFPFGDDERAVRMGAVLTGLEPVPVGVTVAVLGTAGAVVAALLPRWPRLRLVGVPVAVALLFLVPDGRLLLAVGELLTGHADRVEAAAATQAWCTAGALLWAAAARNTPTPSSRGRTVTLVAAALPFVYALPRTLWAAGLTFGLDRETTRMVSTSEGRARELIFAAAAGVGGLLTLGLTQRWGSRLPAWVPLIGQRRVPRLLATVPATAVAVILTGAGITMWRVLAAALADGGSAGAAFDVANWAAWAGNLIWLPWGVTLGLATRAYHRRRHMGTEHRC